MIHETFLLESDLLPPLLGDLQGLDVADLGCGTGRQSLRMVSMGSQVTAVDFSDGMLAQALRKPGRGDVSFVKADLGGRFPFRDRVFDRVVSCLVLDHKILRPDKAGNTSTDDSPLYFAWDRPHSRHLYSF